MKPTTKRTVPKMKELSVRPFQILLSSNTGQAYNEVPNITKLYREGALALISANVPLLLGSHYK